LTYSGWLTQISGHPSATSRARDSESTSAKDQCSTAGPRNQLGCIVMTVNHSIADCVIFGNRSFVNATTCAYIESLGVCPNGPRPTMCISGMRDAARYIKTRACMHVERRRGVRDTGKSYVHEQVTRMTIVFMRFSRVILPFIAYASELHSEPQSATFCS